MLMEAIEPSVIDRVKAGTYLGYTDDLPNSAYHAAPGLSSTGLKEIAKSPAHYQAYLHAEREVSDDMRLGTLVHLLALERHRFAECTALIDTDGRTKEGKAQRKAAEDAGKIIIKGQEELDQIQGMVEAIYSHSEAEKYLRGGVAERSFFWRDEATGVLLKCRPDYYIENAGVLVDIKTVQPDKVETLRALDWHGFNSKWHWQSALYLSGVNQYREKPTNMFVHIVVEKKPSIYLRGKLTYIVRPWALNLPSLEKAELDYRPHLETYAACELTGVWPGPAETLESGSLPDKAWEY